jgi:hypothetical protein
VQEIATKLGNFREKNILIGKGIGVFGNNQEAF